MDIESEKDLHIKDGFGARKHHPDFVFKKESRKFAIEIELNPKGKERLEKNIQENYLNYTSQMWITDNSKVRALIKDVAKGYSNIMVIPLEKILKDNKDLYV